MAIPQLPQTPNVGPEVPNTLWKWLIEMGNRIRQLIDFANKPVSTAVPAHAANHATGGSDELTPADIGAAVADHVHNENIGEVKSFARQTAPAKFLKANGQTIGSASSGATARANADTQALFEMLWADWANTVLPIQDSSGGSTTRGASGAADFAANKRLPLPDIRGEFVRGWDDGRGVDSGRGFGSAQSHNVQDLYAAVAATAHNKVVSTPSWTATNVFSISTNNASSASSATGIDVGSRGTGETRPRNVALLYCIRYLG